ncbi:hypothetical protein RFI02_02145 [Acinetobacter sichuanensis]|uniref:hypothetical protein n=1 Tax=Acinetobacter sichuanensis TaxID=2136183 RepID=UPI00280EDE65|nr:hypothetical protein [Acinetobacter sichuanensis]MDQ9019901.1 hypothetical protein [Acinetobacter sichuanensis]
MTNQKKECCECSKVLELLIQQNNKLIEQNNQLIQINNEQNAQINHLLEHLDEDQEVDGLSGRSLDGG